MVPRLSSSGAVEVPDFSSVPDLKESEKRRIRSYASLHRAGRAVAAVDLLDESDMDSVWVGGVALAFTLERLRRLIDAADDEVLKRCLEERRRCLQEADESGVVPTRSSSSGGRYSGACSLWGTVLCQNLPEWTETCQSGTFLPAEVPSNISPVISTTSLLGSLGKENEDHAGGSSPVESLAVLGSDLDEVCNSVLTYAVLV